MFRTYYFYVTYPISGYAYHGRGLKKVSASSEDTALVTLAFWLKANKRTSHWVKDWSTEDIIGELSRESGDAYFGDLYVSWLEDEED
jgi:hypothetical protein